jgi:hypothetical protein
MAAAVRSSVSGSITSPPARRDLLEQVLEEPAVAPDGRLPRVADQGHRAHGGLHNLGAFTRWAELGGVPEAISSSFAEQAGTARDALWRCADRIARARKRGPRAAALLDGEAVNLAKLVEGVRHARLALLELCVLALREEHDQARQGDVARRGLGPLQEAARQLDSSAPHLPQ